LKSKNLLKNSVDSRQGSSCKLVEKLLQKPKPTILICSPKKN